MSPFATPRFLYLFGLVLSSIINAEPAAPAPVVQSGPLIVLKLDDMVTEQGKVPARWKRVTDFAETRGLKISIGIIGNSLEGESPPYFAELKRLAGTGLIELWNHGYDHRRWTEEGKTVFEFLGPNEEQQREHVLRGQRLAQEKLGVTFRAFGSPFNANDTTTARVLAEIPEIRVWLYGDAKTPAGKFVARRVGAVNIESPVHKPNLAALISGLAAHAGEPYFVIQGHPNSWGETGFAEFVRIVDHLQTGGAKFILPSELPTALAVPAL